MIYVCLESLLGCETAVECPGAESIVGDIIVHG